MACCIAVLTRSTVVNNEDADEVSYEKEKIADGEEYVSTDSGWIWRGGISEIKNSEAAVLGSSTALFGNLSIISKFKFNLWQKIMGDEKNKKTLNMRGLKITNWMIRNWFWRELITRT